MARVPAVRRHAGARTSASSGPSCSTPTGASSSAARCATSTRREWFDHRYRFKPRELGAGPSRRARARGDRRLHVRPARGDRARRTARRALPDGLRGRRLVPARLAGGLSRASTFRPPACITTSRSRAAPSSASASAASQRAVLGALGRLLRRAPRARARPGALRVVYVTEDTGVGGGHRDIFEHLNRPARPRARGRAVHARRPAGLV